MGGTGLDRRNTRHLAYDPTLLRHRRNRKETIGVGLDSRLDAQRSYWEKASSFLTLATIGRLFLKTLKTPIRQIKVFQGTSEQPPFSLAQIEITSLGEVGDLAVGDGAFEHPEAAVGVDEFDASLPEGGFGLLD